MAEERFATLSRAKRELVRLMQEIDHGRLENFAIVSGEPDLTSPTIIHELRVPAGDRDSRPSSEPFGLKASIVTLFELFGRYSDARIRWLEIRGGLPVRIAVERQGDGVSLRALRERGCREPKAGE